MDLNITGKRAFIGAASQGLGRAAAEALAAEGVNLVICARTEDVLQRTADELASTYKVQVEAMTGDLSQPEIASRIIDQAIEKLGGIDILVNNIGGPPPSSAVETDTNLWERGFQQLFLSANIITRQCLPKMMEANWGRIVNITSISVVEPIEHLVVSTAMRAAVTAFAKTLATEVAHKGVTVNTLMPGVIHTDRIEKLRLARAERQGTSLEVEMENTKKTIPMNRLGRPEELGAMIAFLSSTKAAYITGQNICIDGGLRRSWV